jgi:hypothetical protein
MTARRTKAYACHVDTDLAHVTGPCSRVHAPVPVGAVPGPDLIPATRATLLPDPTPEKSTPKAPAKRAAAPVAARSTPKRAKPKRAPGRPYADEDRRKALDVLLEHGMAEAHRRSKVPKATLSRWAKAAGIDLGEDARRRTADATAAVEAKAAELARTTVDRLEGILMAELTAHEQLLELELLAARLAADAAVRVLDGDQPVEAQLGMMGNAYLVLKRPDSKLGQVLGLLELLAPVGAKRDRVGSWTRANHDLALLKGEATERGDVVVRFGIPRPDAAASDASAVEVDLSIEAGER